MNALLIIVTAIYAGQAAIYFASGNRPLALVLVGYTIANVGLIWSTKQ